MKTLTPPAPQNKTALDGALRRVADPKRFSDPRTPAPQISAHDDYTDSVYVDTPHDDYADAPGKE